MRCGTASRPTCSKTTLISEPSRFCSEGRHTAHEQQAEARITYRFHPRFGEIVRVRRRLQRGGAAFLVVHQLDGTFACLPAWMTDEAASRFEISVEPHFPLDVLCSLRNEVDALLGFLASESKTERPDNDASIRESPDKPVRGRATVRRTACSSKERARDGHRGAAARDRGGAGQGGNRGERRCPRARLSISPATPASTSGNRQQTSSRIIMRADGANTVSSIAPSSLAGATSKSSTTTSSGPAAASRVPASSGCLQRSATAVSALCSRSRRRVLPAMAATGIR